MKAEECPWCGIAPRITKHFRDEAYTLMHRCKVMGLIRVDWKPSDSELIAQWNISPIKKEG